MGESMFRLTMMRECAGACVRMRVCVHVCEQPKSQYYTILRDEEK